MQTVIGAFDDRHVAERALERLVASGIAREDVHLQAANAAAGNDDDRTTDRRAVATAERELAIGPHVMSAIDNFFDLLFGGHHGGHADTYAEAVRRGGCVVVVDTSDDAQAGRVGDLLHELGAIDVDERAQQWRAAGWSGGADAGREERLGTTAGLRGARVIHRGAQPPLREIVGQRAQEAERAGVRGTTRPEDVRSAALAADRAYASGRPGDAPADTRDPDATTSRSRDTGERDR